MREDWVDLHVHTNFSDGLLTPAQVVQKARDRNLRAVGIADHDTIGGIAEAFEAGTACGIEIVPGLELSSQYEGKDLHILGYYFDPVHPRLEEYLEKFQLERYRRAAKMVQNLNHMGIHLSMSEVAGKSRSRNIGRPHLAEILMEKGYVETFQEAFQRFIGYGAKAYEEKFRIRPDEAISLITEAKGLSFLAHPGPIISDETLLYLMKSGLDGIEIIHPNLYLERTEHLQRFTADNGLLVCGGSDCHGGRDGKIRIGQYRIPYALLETMKDVIRKRWNIDDLGMNGRMNANGTG